MSLIEPARVIAGPGKSHHPDRSIGAMLIDQGKLRPQDAEKVLHYARDKGVRFGDAAVALNLVSADDLQHALARQFDYPYLVPGESHVSKHVVAAWEPFSKQVEALRAIRSQLLLRWFTGEGEHKALTVVSASSGDGRSYLAANLAVVFSQMGEHTLLIDADMRQPQQHVLFGATNSVGLSAVLSDRADLEVIQRVPAFVDLSLLAAGARPPNPLELLGRDSFSRLIETAKKEYDVIIVDVPAMESGSDYQFALRGTQAALMVVRRNKSRMSQCAKLAGDVAATSARLVGTVLSER